MPYVTTLIWYADDLVVVVTAKDAPKLVTISKRVLNYITYWMQRKLVAQKTEVVLHEPGRRIKEITTEIGNTFVTIQEAVKYLGIHLDSNMYMG